MPVPEYLAKYYEQSPLDLVIADVIKNTEGQLVVSQINRVKTIASIQAGIDKYRAEAKNMSQKQLSEDPHNSTRLGVFLDALVMRRPPRCHAHAVISGTHPDAAILRLRMAFCKMRRDDIHNGCWLPENTAATPHPAFPKAPPHSRIHRKNYYMWLNRAINRPQINNYNTMVFALKRITQHLHEHTFPEFVMQKGRVK